MFKIKMAGLTIQINNQYGYVQRLCRDYIVEDSASADFEVSTSADEIAAQMADDSIVFSPEYCEALCIYRNICLRLPVYDAFLIHGAAIAVDGEAYLFLAKSGVGKTTHMRYWMDTFGERAQVVNGDKPIIRRLDNKWVICGAPWCGKENLGNNVILPLKAFCFLERSLKNSICPAKKEQITGRIFQQLLMPKEEKELTLFFTLLEDFLRNVPGYILNCNQEKEAALVSFDGMQ